MKTEAVALENRFKLKMTNPKIRTKTMQGKTNYSNIIKPTSKPIKINNNPKNRSNFIPSKTKESNHNNNHSDLTKNAGGLNKKRTPSITKCQKPPKISINQNMKLKKKCQKKIEDKKLNNEKEIIPNQQIDKYMYTNAGDINDENLNLFQRRDKLVKNS